MSQQSINLGSQVNDGTGDSIRDAFDKVNTNFTEVYSDLTLFNTVFSTGTQALSSALATVYSVTATMANFSATQALFQQDLNDVANLLSGFQSTLTSQTTRITTLESTVTSVRSTVSSHTTQLADISTRVTSLENTVTDLVSFKTDFATTGSLTGAKYAAITSLVSNSTASIATRLTTLESSFTNFSSTSLASISYVDQAITSSTASIASSLQTLTSAFATTASLAGASFIGLTSLITSSTASIASRISTLESNYSSLSTSTTATASISYVDQAVASSTASLALAISTLTASFNNITGTITTLASVTATIAGIQTSYGVSLNANGHVAGFRILDNSTGTSSFIVQADQFAVETNSGSLTPFSVSGDTVTMQNVNIASTLTVGSSPVVSGTSMTGAGAKINSNGTFALGNTTTNISYNGSQMYLNGNIIGTGNIQSNAINKLTQWTVTDANRVTSFNGNLDIPSGGNIFASTSTIFNYAPYSANSIIQLTGDATVLIDHGPGYNSSVAWVLVQMLIHSLNPTTNLYAAPVTNNSTYSFGNGSSKFLLTEYVPVWPLGTTGTRPGIQLRRPINLALTPYNLGNGAGPFDFYITFYATFYDAAGAGSDPGNDITIVWQIDEFYVKESKV